MSNIHQLLSSRFAGYSAFVIRYWIFAFASITNTEHPMSNIHQLLSTRFPGYSAFVIRYWIFAFASITNTEHPMSNIHQLLSTRFPGYSAFAIQNWLFIFAAMSISEHPAPKNEKAPLSRGFIRNRPINHSDLIQYTHLHLTVWADQPKL
jgi:hypothetical protein